MEKNMADRGYPIVVIAQSEDEGGGFIAYAPDLHGCVGDGDRPESAITNLLSAIEEWIDEARRLSRDIPAPRALAEQAKNERREIESLLRAQQALINKQTSLLRESKAEIEKLKDGILALGNDDARAERSYFTWGGYPLPPPVARRGSDRKNKRVAN
jgi:antitoxin HicB